MELLKEKQAGDVVVIAGGTIPADDIAELKKIGVAEVFTPGASTQDIIDFVRGAVRPWPEPGLRTSVGDTIDQSVKYYFAVGTRPLRPALETGGLA